MWNIIQSLYEQSQRWCGAMLHPLWQVVGLFIWILTPGQRKTSSNLLKAVQGALQTWWGANTLQPLWEVGELLRCPVGWVYPQLVEYHIISFPLSHSFNDRKSVLIILLLGSVDVLHYTVTATVDFVLGMYFNLTSSHGSSTRTPAVWGGVKKWLLLLPMGGVPPCTECGRRSKSVSWEVITN